MDAPQLFCGDCLEVMAHMPAASVDMVLCDLPYGTTRNKWDATIPFEPLWAEYRRLVRPGGAIVLTAAQPFTSALVMSNPAWFRHEWVWHKNKASGHLNANKRPMRAHEDILVFADRQPFFRPLKSTGHKPGNYAMRSSHGTNYGAAALTEYGGSTERYPQSVLPVPVVNNNDPDKSHPTQKPVALMEYLIKTYTNPGEVVLDNCMGSGTAGVAAANTGRRFVGIEKDPAFFQIAQLRVLAANDNRPSKAEVQPNIIELSKGDTDYVNATAEPIENTTDSATA